ncbi:MAG: ubiquinol-cytochrome c reductase iron-sulfur subunit [Chloroflexota bacterium]|nr:ubiquinol-cytochrome c reductase iron-sulfur subunit [Chloroflexota bacterium]
MSATVQAAPGNVSEPVSRRNALRLMLGGAVGLATAEFAVTSATFLWPVLKGALGSVVNVGKLTDFPSVTPKQGEPVHVLKIKTWVVNLVDFDKTVQALYQVCPHLGCAVPYCGQSGRFECPCHGSTYNLHGEWLEGPAPRGMDRFAAQAKDGDVLVDTTTLITGPKHGTHTIDDTPRGPRCS